MTRIVFLSGADRLDVDFAALGADIPARGIVLHLHLKDGGVVGIGFLLVIGFSVIAADLIVEGVGCRGHVWGPHATKEKLAVRLRKEGTRITGSLTAPDQLPLPVSSEDPASLAEFARQVGCEPAILLRAWLLLRGFAEAEHSNAHRSWLDRLLRRNR